MIPFDTFTLAAVAAELRQALLGARVQKIQQPSPNEIVLSLYGRAGAERLLISADPRRFRVHATQIRQANPITPPGFCQVCRKDLEGARLDEITMPRFDRVLQIGFHAHDGEPVRLIAELMGRNANLVLISGGGEIRGVLRPAPGGERDLRPHAPYADPPGYHDKQDPLVIADTSVFRTLPDGPPEAQTTWLMNTFSGIGRFAAGEIVVRAQHDGAISNALLALMDDVRAERFAPHSIADAQGATEGVWAFAPLSVPPGRRFPRESVLVSLDTFYATLAEQGTEAAEKTALARTIAREITFREKERSGALATLAEAGRADAYERVGNTLLAHLGHIERGRDAVTLPDPYDASGAETTIALDAKRSPQENAQRYFDRARKARDAAVYAGERLEETEAELAALAVLQGDLERADDADALETIRRTLTELAGAKRVEGAKPAGERSSRPRPGEKPFGGHRIRTYTVDGYTLLVGETAEANDFLTTRVAAPADLWLHVRAGTGAHGVLRTGGNAQAVPDATLRRAAGIVAARSGSAVKHAGVVAVDVVEKRHVRKPRGARAGLVTYTRERTLDVEPAL